MPYDMKTNLLDDRTLGVYSTASRSGRSFGDHLDRVMGLTEEGKRVGQVKRTTSGTSPTVLLEGAELSVLLNQNHSPVPQGHTATGHRDSTPQRTARTITFDSPISKFESSSRIKMAELLRPSTPVSEEKDYPMADLDAYSPIPVHQPSVHSPPKAPENSPIDASRRSRSTLFSASLRSSSAMRKYLDRQGQGQGQEGIGSPHHSPVHGVQAHSSPKGEEESKFSSGAHRSAHYLSPASPSDGAVPAPMTRGTSFQDLLDTAITSIPHSEDASLVVFSIKLLMRFQQWLLASSRPASAYAHILRLQSLSPLYQLEIWMREKMLAFARRETMHRLFVEWSSATGVSHIGRQAYHHHLLRCGWEAWMEYKLRKTMKKTNALQIYGMRRYEGGKALPVRHVIDRAHTVYRSLIRQHASQRFKALETAQYHASQDLVALFFAFRRLQRRTFHASRALQVTEHTHKLVLKKSFSVWLAAHTIAARDKDRLFQRADKHHQMVLQTVTRARAFQVILDNVSHTRRQRTALSAMRSNILARPMAIKALYMLSLRAYLRCFLAWKENSQGSNAISKKVIAMTFRRNALKRCVRTWKKTWDSQARSRMSSFRGERSLKDLDLASASLDVFIGQHCPRRLPEKARQFVVLRRALHSLRRRAHRAGIFSTFPEMRFAHFMMNPGVRSHLNDQAHAQYVRLVHTMSSHYPGQANKLIYCEKGQHRLKLVQVADAALEKRRKSTGQLGGGVGTLVEKDKELRSCADFLSPLHSKASHQESAGFYSPKGSLPVHEYLDLLGRKSLQALRGYPIVPTATMQIAIRKWHQHTARHHAKNAIERMVRIKHETCVLQAVWKNWKVTCMSVSKWKANRRANAVKLWHRYAISTAITDRAHRLTNRFLRRHAVRQLFVFQRTRQQQRLQAVTAFCNTIFSSMPGGLAHFITCIGNFYRPYVSQSLQLFVEHCRTFRFDDQHPCATPTVRLKSGQRQSLSIPATALAGDLAVALRVYQSLHRGLAHLRAHALRKNRQNQLVKAHRLLKVNKVFQFLRRHRCFGRLRKAIRRQKYRKFMLRWKAALTMQRSHMLICKQTLVDWKRQYSRGIYIRVWERAWGMKQRAAFVQWQAFCKRVDGLVEGVQRLRDKYSMKFVVGTWKSLLVAARAHKNHQRHRGLIQWLAFAKHCRVLREKNHQALFWFRMHVLEKWKAATYTQFLQHMGSAVGQEWRDKHVLVDALQKMSRRTHGRDQGILRDVYSALHAHRLQQLADVQQRFLVLAKEEEISTRYEHYNRLLWEERKALLAEKRMSRQALSQIKPSGLLAIRTKSSVQSIAMEQVHSIRVTGRRATAVAEEANTTGISTRRRRRESVEERHRGTVTAVSAAAAVSCATRNQDSKLMENSDDDAQFDQSSVPVTSRRATPTGSTARTYRSAQTSPMPITPLAVSTAGLTTGRSARSTPSIAMSHQGYPTEQDVQEQPVPVIRSILTPRSAVPAQPTPRATPRGGYQHTPRSVHGFDELPDQGQSRGSLHHQPHEPSQQQRVTPRSSQHTPRSVHGFHELPDPGSSRGSSQHHHQQQPQQRGANVASPIRATPRTQTSTGSGMSAGQPRSVRISQTDSTRGYTPRDTPHRANSPNASFPSHTDSVSRVYTPRDMNMSAPRATSPNANFSRAASPRATSPRSRGLTIDTLLDELPASPMRSISPLTSRSRGRTATSPASSPSHMSPHRSPYLHGADSITAAFPSPIGSQYLQPPARSVNTVQSVATAAEAVKRRALHLLRRYAMRRRTREMMIYYKHSAAARRSLLALRYNAVRSARNRYRLSALQTRAWLIRWVQHVNKQHTAVSNMRFVANYHLIMTMRKRFKRLHSQTKRRAFRRDAAERADHLHRMRSLVMAIYHLKAPVLGSVRCVASLDSGRTESTLPSDEEEDGLPYYRKLAKQHHLQSKRGKGDPYLRGKTKKHKETGKPDPLRLTASNMIFQLTKRLMFSPV